MFIIKNSTDSHIKIERKDRTFEIKHCQAISVNLHYSSRFKIYKLKKLIGYFETGKNGSIIKAKAYGHSKIEIVNEYDEWVHHGNKLIIA